MPRVSLPAYVPASFAISSCGIVLALIGMLILQQAGTAQRFGALIRHTHDLLSDVSEINILIRDAERGQRGYVLTGRTDYLAPYDNALKRLPPLYEHFRQLTAGNARQQQEMVSIESLMQRKMAELEQTIQLRTNSGEEAAKRVILTDLGRRLMTQITVELDAEENRQLLEGSAAVEQAEARMRELTLGGVVLAALFLSLTALMLRRNLARRREIEREKDRHRQELERSNTDLEQFAYIASHDLKAPLRAISHLADWINEDVKPTANPDTIENLKMLQDRVCRMQMLLDGLLAYARVGHTNCPVEFVDIAEVVRNIVAMRPPSPGFVVACQGTMSVLRTHLTPIQVVLEESDRQRIEAS